MRCPVVSGFGVAWPWGYRLHWHSQEPLFSTDCGFRELPGGEYPGKKRSVTALRAPSWQVGFLASHPNSQGYCAWVSFCFALIYAKVVYCKIHEHSWVSCPHESSDHGMVVQRAGHSHLCLSAAGRKQAMSTDPSERALGMKGWRHLLSCSGSGVFGTPVGWYLTHISAQYPPSTSATILDTILCPHALSRDSWSSFPGPLFQYLHEWRLHNLSGQPAPMSGHPLYSWSPVITWASFVLPFYGSVLSGALCSSMQAPATTVFQTVGMDSS